MSEHITGLVAALPAFVSHEEYRPALRAPFTIEYEGERWAVATNGHKLLAVRGDHGFPWWEDVKAPDAAAVLVRPATSAVPVSLAALLDFVGPVPPTPVKQECVTCGGTGTVDHECDCDYCDEEEEECPDCDGDGKAVPQEIIRPAWIGNALFDRNLLAPALAALPSDLAAVWAQAAPEKPALLSGDGWVVLFMALRTDLTYHDAPRFDPLTPRAFA